MAITNRELDKIKGRNCGHCFWMKVILFQDGVRKRRYADCRHEMKFTERGHRGWLIDSGKSCPIPRSWTMQAENCVGYEEMRDE